MNKDIENFENMVANLEFKKMLSDKKDIRSAILNIKSRTCGTESQDWAEMLLRMCLRYCEKQGYRTSLVDRLALKEINKSSKYTSSFESYAFLVI